MITMLRLDDRLIHGQVAIRWSKVLGVNMIVVANDEVVKDKIGVGALKMAAPPGIKCSVLSIEDTIKNCTDERAKGMSIMVITNCFPDTLAIMKGAKDVIERVNIGNHTIHDSTGEQALNQYCYMSDADIACAREMLTIGLKVDTQLRPEFPAPTLEEELNKLK